LDSIDDGKSSALNKIRGKSITAVLVDFRPVAHLRTWITDQLSADQPALPPEMGRHPKHVLLSATAHPHD
jgi:hypothetical protein